MANLVLIYTGAFLPFVWGLSHLFPTSKVVKGFGDISADNRRIITMEWIVEGVSLMFIGLLVAAVTYVDCQSAVSELVYVLSSSILLVLAIVSLCTGARISFLPFRLCPVVFTSSSILILVGTYI